MGLLLTATLLDARGTRQAWHESGAHKASDIHVLHQANPHTAEIPETTSELKYSGYY